MPEPVARPQKRGVLPAIALVVGIFALAIAAVLLWRSIASRPSGQPFTTIPTPTPDPMAPKNVLLMGYGGAGHDGGLLTDTMIVGHIIPKEKKVVLISIPRDLWVPVEIVAGTESGRKINAVYAIGTDHKSYPNVPEKYRTDKGGLDMASDVVGKIIGEPIDWAVAVDFSGFTKLIKTLGGIFVEVPYTFEDKQYPVKGKEKETCRKSEEDIKALSATMSGALLEKEFPCRYETISFTKGKQFMDAETALKFVRSRHSDVGGGDFGRSLRQQAFLLGVKNRLLSFETTTKIIPLLKDGLDMVNTDLTFQDITAMLQRYGNISSYTTDTIHITDETVLTITMSSDGQYILVPDSGEKDFSAIRTYILSELTRMSQATGSAVVQ